MRWAIKYNLGYKNIYFYILPLIKFHFKNIKIKYINKYQYLKLISSITNKLAHSLQ
jgi:hypothetical protein